MEIDRLKVTARSLLVDAIFLIPWLTLMIIAQVSEIAILDVFCCLGGGTILGVWIGKMFPGHLWTAVILGIVLSFVFVYGSVNRFDWTPPF